ncbi:MAG: hypothetical protein LBH05_00545 [Deferribacteraceae bacterium]|jgi:hypothetical protein|nr:hypothetical protein [Deferribacteraceae bacterium]
MKKTLVLALTAAAFIASGCMGSIGGTYAVSSSPSVVTNRCMTDAPGWVIKGSSDTSLSSVDSAKIKTPAGSQFAYAEATGNARDKLEKSFEVKINTMLRNFTTATGIGDELTSVKIASSVSKQITNQTLASINPKSVFQSSCGEMYVLLLVNSDIIRTAVKQSVTSAYQNEEDLLQEFLSPKAQEKLNTLIASEFPD